MRKEAISLQVRLVVQIEESPERLAFNHRLDGGIVGEMSTSIASLTNAVRSRAERGIPACRATPQPGAGRIERARQGSAIGRGWRRVWNREPSSMPRVMAELRRGAAR